MHARYLFLTFAAVLAALSLGACQEPPAGGSGTVQGTPEGGAVAPGQAAQGRAPTPSAPANPVPAQRQDTVATRSQAAATAPPPAEPAEPESLVSAQSGAAAPLMLMEQAADSVAGRERKALLKRSAPALASIRPPSEPSDRENYAHVEGNPVKRVAEEPVSTFSIDVDTGAYSNVRRMLNAGRRPPRDAVRVEELINYFAYDYPLPEGRDQPFRVTTELGPNPWNPKTRLLRIGIKGYELPAEALPAANLVFLVDVSGSMNSPAKLGLLKSALRLLAQRLDQDDRVSIAVYAGAAGVVLEPTPGNEQAKIVAALDGLSAGGSTNGGAGIRLAYNLARQAFIPGGINRVLLATDGDFNVGTVSFEALLDLIREQRESGVGLTTLGFGSGNYNDRLMEQAADAGNGNYAYIDTLNEARKVLVQEMSSTLVTIAKDVKIQIEFNPAVVAEYRLIGYENRVLAREDFSNDRVDAGEIGAGHTVTALYELALVGGGGERMESLRYAQAADAHLPRADELAFLRLRHKQPAGDASRLMEWPLHARDGIVDLKDTSDDYRFAAAVAGFGQLLRGGKYLEGFGYDAVLELARGARGSDPFGYRGEFLGLVGLAKVL